MPWTFLDQIDWLSAQTEKEKRAIWQRSHPGQSHLDYTNCQDIKASWRTGRGQLQFDLYNFWSRLQAFILNPEPRIDCWRWKLSWARRCFWRDFTNKYISNPEIDIYEPERNRPAIAQDVPGDLDGYFLTPSGKLLNRQWWTDAWNSGVYSMPASSDLFSLANQEMRERRSVQRCTDRPDDSEVIEVEVL